MKLVLDAYAVIAYLEKDRGFEFIQESLNKAAKGQDELFMSTVNWGEVYYIVQREFGSHKANEVETLIETFPIQIIPIDKALAKQAAQYKAGHKMSYADCFAAALAKMQKSTLVTGDKEFRAVEGEIKICWI